MRNWIPGLTGFWAIAVLSLTAPPWLEAAAPINDSFANRIAVTGLPLRLVGDTTEATVEPEEATEIQPGWGRRLERSVWWSWTATKSGVVGIYYAMDPIRGLRVYAGNQWNELLAVPLSLLPEGTGPSRRLPVLTDWSFRAEAGVTYQIAVYDAGPFTLDLMERPLNDFFEDRLQIPSEGGDILGTTTNATYETGEPTGGSKSIWYSWTPDFSGQALFVLSDGNGTNGLEVFSGESLATLVRLSAAVRSGEKVLYPVSVTAGETYSVRISGRKGPGLFRLRVGRPPPNDDFAAATLLSGYSALIEGTTWGMTVESGEPYMAQATASTGTAWWKWVAPTNGLLRIRAGEQATDFRYWVPYRLFTGTSLSNLRRLGSPSGNTGSGYPDYYHVARGRTYYLRVEDADFIKIQFDLFPRPVNDNFDQRLALEGLSVSTQGDNLLATRQKGEPVHGGYRSGNSVWWTWKAPMSGYVFVNSSGSDFGNVMAAYTGDSLPRLELVADNRVAYWTGALGFPVEAGVSYHVAVSGVVEDDGELGNSRVTRGLIKLAFDFTTLAFSSPANGSVLVGPTDVTLSLNTPLEAVDGNVVSADFYARQYLWDPSSMVSVGAMASAPFSLTLTGLTPGIRVYSADVANHLGQTRAAQPAVFAIRPPNDNFSESIPLEPIPGITRGWIGGASWEAREKRPLKANPIAGSSWWVWTAPQTGQFRVRVNTMTWFVLYKGPSLGALKTVAKFGFGENIFEAVKGETYHLQAFSKAQLPWDVATDVEFTLSQ